MEPATRARRRSGATKSRARGRRRGWTERGGMGSPLGGPAPREAVPASSRSVRRSRRSTAGGRRPCAWGSAAPASPTSSTSAPGVRPVCLSVCPSVTALVRLSGRVCHKKLELKCPPGELKTCWPPPLSAAARGRAVHESQLCCSCSPMPNVSIPSHSLARPPNSHCSPMQATTSHVPGLKPKTFPVAFCGQSRTSRRSLPRGGDLCVQRTLHVPMPYG